MVQEPLRQEVRMEKGDGMKKVFGTIAILSFLFLLGTVGSVEQDMIPLGTGLFAWSLALPPFGCSHGLPVGLITPIPSMKTKKAALGVADRKAASAKAHSDYIRYF